MGVIMKYCGVVTDRSYGDCKHRVRSSCDMDSLTRFEMAIDAKKRRIYSDEVPTASKDEIYRIKDRTVRLINLLRRTYER